MLQYICPLQAQDFMPGKAAPYKYVVDRRVDNMGYWKKMAEWGLVPVTPPMKIPAPTYKSSVISDAAVATPNSPDVPVTDLNSLQSENSVFIHPNNRNTVLNSNNSCNNPYPGYFFGADGLYSNDGGESWEGQVGGTGGYNMGDPSTAINSNGRWFVGFIHSGGGQALAYSNDEGVTWKVRAIASPPDMMGGLLDKSHLWVDNSPSSPYKSNMYDGWTVITGPDDGVLQVSRSTDKGLGWQIPVAISDSAHAKSHNQGINIATGPNGEVYAAWSVYDRFPSDETALGFAASFNGGQTWQPASRILDSIRGIRLHGVGMSMRTNSFPSMAVDNSNSPWRGKIYIVWANVNVPGINSGLGVGVYMISSIDNGNTWSEPVLINQDGHSPDKLHFFPWITCDPANGNLSVIFYDNRDAPPGQIEAWVATSTDGGENWQDFRVSDVAFTPSPLTGLSDNYFGDYLAISASSGLVYPCWTDNRSGVAMAYVSPFKLGPDPGQPYIAYKSSVYNDTLQGNGNGIAEYGEDALLSLSIRNMGDVPDSAVNVILRSDSPYLSFSDSTEYYGDIEAGGSLSKNNAFSLHISSSVPNGLRIPLTLIATDIHDSTYTSYFTIKAAAPEIQIIDLSVDDASSNGNHSLDPGESVNMVLKLKNVSAYAAANVSCNLNALEDYVVLDSSWISIPDMLPAAIEEVVFATEIDMVTTGTLASFLSGLRFSEQYAERRFNKKIGLIFENWESGDLNKFNWVNGGDNPWHIDSSNVYEGKFSLKSGSIGNQSVTTLTVESRALTYDSISFYRKVSSEERFDFLNFYIDGAKVGKWSGEKDWEREVFPVIPGYHTFKWEYSKDQDVINGLDAAFIDFIEFPSVQYTTADAGKDATIFECQGFACNGVATFQDSLRWTTSGSGYFANESNEHTSYFPSESDKEAGSVFLILTVYGSTVNEMDVDSMQLIILPQPTAYAGPDAGICKGESFQVSAASASNYTSLLWGTLGNGTFSDPLALMPTYYPGKSDTINGYADLVMISYAGNNDACGYAVDTLRLELYSLPEIPIASFYDRCAGYSVTLDASLEGGLSYLWSPGGSSSAELRIDSTGIGVGEKQFTVEVIGNHGCRAEKSATVRFKDCTEKVQAGSLFFRVFPNPAVSGAEIELFSELPQTIEYSITNSSGQRVFSSGGFEIFGLQNREIEIQNLSQGTYHLTVIAGKEKASVPLIIL